LTDGNCDPSQVLKELVLHGIYRKYCDLQGVHYCRERMAHPTTEAIILQFATDRATNYRWRMLYMVGHALNTIHGYEPGESWDGPHPFPQWPKFYVKERCVSIMFYDITYGITDTICVLAEPGDPRKPR